MQWFTLSIIFTSVVIPLVASTSGAYTCSEGWLVVGQNCFKLYQEKRTWGDSRNVCLDNGGHLATIPDEQTNQVLTTQLFSNHNVSIWLGLNDIDGKGNYTWADSPNNPAYRNWYPDQPNDYLARESCINIWSFVPGHKWADRPCSVKNHFLCQMTAVNNFVKKAVFENPDEIQWGLDTYRLQLLTDVKNVTFQKHGDVPGLTLDSNGLVTVNVMENRQALRHELYSSDLEFEAITNFGVSSKYRPDISLCLCEKEEQCTNASTKSTNLNGNIYNMECNCGSPGPKLGRYCEKDVCESCPCGNKSPLQFKCQTGFEMHTVNNKVVCKDIDECKNKNGGCDHSCINIPGSWKCSCRVGFQQRGKKCVKFICPYGWSTYKNECFKLYRQPKTWQEARAQCLSERAHLAFVPDDGTHSFLFKEFVSNDTEFDIWIALNDIKTENKFEWADSKKEITYRRWGPDQPNNYGEQDCGCYWRTYQGYWADYQCYHKYHFICQKKPDYIRPSCPANWDWYDNECFTLFRTKETWYKARDKCLAQEAHLAVVPNVQIHDFLYKNYVSNDPGNDIWIGLNDIKRETNFHWEVRDSTLKTASYRRWDKSQPNNYQNQDCVGYWERTPGLWADFTCNLHRAHYFCQKIKIIDFKNPTSITWHPGIQSLQLKTNYERVTFGKYGILPGLSFDSNGLVSINVTENLAELRTILYPSVLEFEAEASWSYPFLYKPDIFLCLCEKQEQCPSKGTSALSVSGKTKGNVYSLACNCQGKAKGRYCEKIQGCETCACETKHPQEFECPYSYGLNVMNQMAHCRVCGGVYKTWHGTLETPNYPRGHARSKLCRWEIEVGKGYTIRLMFNFPFSLLDGDYLQLFEVSDEGALSIKGKWSGTVIPTVQRSSTSKIVLAFHSSGSGRSKGIQAVWDREDIDECLLDSDGCDHNCKNTFGSFVCSCRDGYKLTGKKCEDIDECVIDNGGCDHHCENTNGSFECSCWVGYKLNGGKCEDIDECLVGNGGCDHDCKNTNGSFVCSCRDGYKMNGTKCEASISCGGVMNGSRGSFTSPGFPNSSPANIDCKWEIGTLSGQRILLDLDLHLDSNCSKDNVEVSDFSSGTLMSKGIWCGTTKPSRIISDTSRIMVTFHSGADTEGERFSASWIAVGSKCVATFNTVEGAILSSNYPKHYPDDMNCRWEIDPPKGTNITLQFDPIFDLEQDTDCAWDYVEVTRKDELVGRWCGSKAPPPVVSNGEKLVVVFKSDDGNPGRGFLARWNISS